MTSKRPWMTRLIFCSEVLSNPTRIQLPWISFPRAGKWNKNPSRLSRIFDPGFTTGILEVIKTVENLHVHVHFKASVHSFSIYNHLQLLTTVFLVECANQLSKGPLQRLFKTLVQFKRMTKKTSRSY